MLSTSHAIWAGETPQKSLVEKRGDAIYFAVGFGCEVRVYLAGASSNDVSFCFQSAAFCAAPAFGAIPFQAS